MSGPMVCPTNGDSAKLVPGLLPGEKPLQWTPDGRPFYVGLGETAAGTTLGPYKILAPVGPP